MLSFVGKCVQIVFVKYRYSLIADMDCRGFAGLFSKATLLESITPQNHDSLIFGPDTQGFVVDKSVKCHAGRISLRAKLHPVLYQWGLKTGLIKLKNFDFLIDLVDDRKLAL